MKTNFRDFIKEDGFLKTKEKEKILLLSIYLLSNPKMFQQSNNIEGFSDLGVTAYSGLRKSPS